MQALDHATGYLLATAALRGLTDRNLDGRGTRARVSLARTAALLTAMVKPAMVNPESIAPPPTITDDDYLPTLEHTGWGPARRLRPPVQLGTITLQWALPANRLGSDRPEWRSNP